MSDFISLKTWREFPPEEMQQRAQSFRQQMLTRRTVRDFSDRPVARELIEDCLTAAGSAPSGANLQPWHFVVVTNPELKSKIRLAAEKEEQEFYERRAPQEWLDALAPLGTNKDKPFLEIAPYLIVTFSQSYGVLPDGRKVKNYYVAESVGIATGILITAIHNAGLVSLTHTPSPMGFLNEMLGRPTNENLIYYWLLAIPPMMLKSRTLAKNLCRKLLRFLINPPPPKFS